MTLSFIYDENTLKEALSDAIQRVLLLRGRVTIPGLGTFERKHEPAQVVELPDGSVELTPPTDTVAFNPSEKGKSQTLPQELVDELADILTLSHIEIQKTYRELIDKMREQLDQGTPLTFPGLGVLKSGDQPFEPDASLTILWGELPPTMTLPEEKVEPEKQSFPSFFGEEEDSLEVDVESLSDDVWLPSDTPEPHPLGASSEENIEEASFTLEPGETPEPPLSRKEEPKEETMAEEKSSDISPTPPEHPDPSAAVTASAFYNMFRAHPDSPQAADALFWAAENYIKAGQVERAKAVFLEFLNHFPHHPRAEEVRAALDLPPGPPPEPEPESSVEAISPATPPPEEVTPTEASTPPEESPKEWKPLAEALEEKAPPKKPASSIKPPPPPPPQAPPRKRRPTPLFYVILSGTLLVIVLLAFLLSNRGKTPSTPTIEAPQATTEESVSAVPEQPVEESSRPSSETPPPVEGTTPSPATTAGESFDPLRSSEGIIRERGGYTWVVASVASRKKAEEIAARYRSMGFRTGVLEGTIQGRRIFRVGIGQFASIEEAQRARRALPPDAPRDAWILRIR